MYVFQRERNGISIVRAPTFSNFQVRVLMMEKKNRAVDRFVLFMRKFTSLFVRVRKGRCCYVAISYIGENTLLFMNYRCFIVFKN